MATMTGDVLLVGSVPLDTVEDVFRTCGRLLGDRLSSVPDGEIRDRAYWILYSAHRTYYGHPQITTVQRPTPPEWKPTGMDNCWDCTRKDSVTQIRFETLGYANEAIKSYQSFRKFRDAGDILHTSGCKSLSPFLKIRPIFSSVIRLIMPS